VFVESYLVIVIVFGVNSLNSCLQIKVVGLRVLNRWLVTAIHWCKASFIEASLLIVAVKEVVALLFEFTMLVLVTLYQFPKLYYFTPI